MTTLKDLYRKHLAGQHNQQSHAPGGSGGGLLGSRPPAKVRSKVREIEKKEEA